MLEPNSKASYISSPPPYSERDLTQNETGKYESTSDLVIGIDFGTTFTGVAYAHTAGVFGNAKHLTTEDMRKAAERIHVVRTWPSQSNYYAEKTPSIISYNTDPPNWGARVRPGDKPQVAYFKLGLQEGLQNHYNAQTPSNHLSGLSSYLSDNNWRHPDLPTKTSVDYVTDYLKCIYDHISHQVLPARYGPQFLMNQQISYVLTVPAIWSDKAKDFTRKAAIVAGIPEKKLAIISEPEAAALYCATLCNQSDLCKGDKFLVCDAGGGTVVWLSSVYL